MLYLNYSVLMSVYYKEKPEYLKESMLSIYNQTIKTNDFVLVCDGPLNEGLDNVISEMQEKFGGALNVVRLPENGGLGKALNEGIKHCKNELVARMDSDDISYPDRCEKEINVFGRQDVDIVSGIIDEFENTTEKIYSKRVTPENNDDIIRFAKKRCPFNHPCVMYKKTSVQAAGGYQDFYLLEDYFLWVRMLINGSIGYNLQEPILYMRAGNDMYKRRSGWRYVKSQIRLFEYMKKNRFINFIECLTACVIRTISSMAPNFFRKMVYQMVLRK